MSLSPSSPRLVLRSRLRIRYVLIALAGAIALGTLGFHLIEGMSLADSLYMTVQTVTTVGYGDVPPRTTGGRLFAAFLMLIGVGIVAYALSSTVQTVVQSELIATFGMRRRYREMKKLHDHFIICGAGRVGSRIIRDMQRAGVPFVVIEKEAAKVTEFMESGAYVLVRDATLEETLREAGVERARGLAACLRDDADNVYVVLTARDLNRDLYIVSRAVEEEAVSKMIKAGANRVIAPTIIGSHRMAQALMKPAVADFMDSITGDNIDLGFEQVEIAPTSVYVGHKLRTTNIRSELDILVVAIRRHNGEMIFHPTGEANIEANDLLIVAGRAESITELNKLASGTTKMSKV